jgi:hypothetical protein
MQNGDEMEFENSSTCDDVKIRPETLIRGLALPPGFRLPATFDIHVYHPGGIPFIDGTLEDYYKVVLPANHRLYAVVTRPLGNYGNAAIPELCDVRNDQMKLLLSPLYQCNPRGLSEIATLMGYFQHGGAKSNLLLLTIGKLTGFAPFITNLYRLLEHQTVNASHVFPITATLHTVVMSIAPQGTYSDNIFDYTLRGMAYIASNFVPNPLSLNVGDAKGDEVDGLEHYVSRPGQQRHFVVWENDTSGGQFSVSALVRPGVETLRTSLEKMPAFKPVSAVTTGHLYTPAFIAPDSSPKLFLGPGEQPRRIRYIDPVEGVQKEGDCEDLSGALKQIDPAVHLVETDRLDQAVIVCVDRSYSMTWTLEGRPIQRRRRRDSASRPIKDLSIVIRNCPISRVLASLFRLPCVPILVQMYRSCT